MSDQTTPGTARKRVLCLLRNGPSPEALRWTEALARDHEVELLDLTQAGLDYDALLKRVFACERVISW